MGRKRRYPKQSLKTNQAPFKMGGAFNFLKIYIMKKLLVQQLDSATNVEELEKVFRENLSEDDGFDYGKFEEVLTYRKYQNKKWYNWLLDKVNPVDNDDSMYAVGLITDAYYDGSRALYQKDMKAGYNTNLNRDRHMYY